MRSGFAKPRELRRALAGCRARTVVEGSALRGLSASLFQASGLAPGLETRAVALPLQERGLVARTAQGGPPRQKQRTAPTAHCMRLVHVQDREHGKVVREKELQTSFVLLALAH